MHKYDLLSRFIGLESEILTKTIVRLLVQAHATVNYFFVEKSYILLLQDYRFNVETKRKSLRVSGCRLSLNFYG